MQLAKSSKIWIFLISGEFTDKLPYCLKAKAAFYERFWKTRPHPAGWSLFTRSLGGCCSCCLFTNSSRNLPPRPGYNYVFQLHFKASTRVMRNSPQITVRNVFYFLMLKWRQTTLLVSLSLEPSVGIMSQHAADRNDFFSLSMNRPGSALR